MDCTNDIECDIRKIKKENYNNKNEIKKLINLNHPSIINHYDINEIKSLKNVVVYQESLNNGGISIFEASKNNYFNNFEIIRNICEQVLLALRFLDNNKIVHRDLTGSNIIYYPELKSIKIIDFGVVKSKFLNQDFLAPEVLKNDEYSHKSDIWSFGCIVLKNLFGFQDINNIPDDFPNEQYDFIHCCLFSNPIDRLDAYKLLHHPFIINKPMLKYSKTIKSLSFPKKQVEFVNKTEHEVIVLTSGKKSKNKSMIYLNKNESCKIKISSKDLFIGIRFDDGCVLSTGQTKIDKSGSLIIEQSQFNQNIIFPSISLFESISEVIF